MINNFKKSFAAGCALAVALTGGGASDAFNAAAPYVDPATLKNGEILHVPTGTKVSKEHLFDTVADSRVIYIGESHDNPESHLVQLEIIRALNEKFPGQVAVGMEMFRRDAQEKLNDWRDKKLSDGDFKNLYCSNWGDWYNAYAPVLDYMKEHSIPLVGLHSSLDTSRAALKGKTHDDDSTIPVLDLNDPHHKKLNMEIYNQYFSGDGKHAADPDVYYRMMTFWDESMAQSVADFLDNPANANQKLVVLAGDGHEVYGLGIPKRSFRRHPHAYTIILSDATDGTEKTESVLTQAEKSAQVPLARSDFAWKIQDIHVPSGQCRKPAAP